MLRLRGKKAFILVYLDDFGGAELAGNAFEAFNMLGSSLEFFGFQEAVDKLSLPLLKWTG